MHRLEKLREMQRKKERKALSLFLAYQILLLSVTLYLILFTSFFHRQALCFLPPALFLLGFPLTKIHHFLLPRVFCGKVTYLHIWIEHRKKYLSGGAGTTYSVDRIKKMDLVIENENGKSRSFTVPFRNYYEDLKTGDEVIAFRFLDIVFPAKED